MRRLVSLALVLGALAAVAFGVGFVRFAQTIEGEEAKPSRHADGMVVLTGGADRVNDAIGLLAEGHADRLLITGVNPSTSRDALARRIPSAADLIDCCVELGYRALNTLGNARETADWVRGNNMRSVIVVTSNYHMPRAMKEIGALLPETDLQPYSVVKSGIGGRDWWSDPHRVRLIAWEYLKYVAVVIRQGIMPGYEPGEATRVAATGR